MTLQPFTGKFTQQEPIGEDAIAAAVAVLRSGRLHRYNTPGRGAFEVAAPGAGIRRLAGQPLLPGLRVGRLCDQVALRAAGLKAGEPVLTNAFTLAPVPGAIVAAAAVRCWSRSPRPRIDLATSSARSAAGARHVLLSHMRGHLRDMEAVSGHLPTGMACPLIEDCAHTMGAAWAGSSSGNFGLAGCFSTQTYKHLNSGEGGLLASDDRRVHGAGDRAVGLLHALRDGMAPPRIRTVFAGIRLDTPNCPGGWTISARRILRPQLAVLDGNIGAGTSATGPSRPSCARPTPSSSAAATAGALRWQLDPIPGTEHRRRRGACFRQVVRGLGCRAQMVRQRGACRHSPARTRAGATWNFRRCRLRMGSCPSCSTCASHSPSR